MAENKWETGDLVEVVWHRLPPDGIQNLWRRSNQGIWHNLFTSALAEDSDVNAWISQGLAEQRWLTDVAPEEEYHLFDSHGDVWLFIDNRWWCTCKAETSPHSPTSPAGLEEGLAAFESWFGIDPGTPPVESFYLVDGTGDDWVALSEDGPWRILVTFYPHEDQADPENYEQFSPVDVVNAFGITDDGVTVMIP
jgi:hypothetical protein